jgi:2-methylcitrate dehydratase PrpD
MDAIRALVIEHDIEPEQVASIRVATGSGVIPPRGPLRYAKAQTALEGKFCLPFQVAAMVVHRKAGLMEFSDAFVQRPDVQDMMNRVTTLVDPEIAALGHDKLIFRNKVVTKDGRTFENYWDAPYRGGPLNPLSAEDLGDKFRDASQSVLGEPEQRAIIDAFSALEDLADVAGLVATAGQGVDRLGNASTH